MKRLVLLTLVTVLIVSSCNDSIETDDVCGFAPASSNWANLDPLYPGEYACADCYITIDFNGQTYQFENSQYEVNRRVTGVEHLYQTHSYSNAFFTFTVVIPDDMELLEASLNQETTLLTYEEMFASDPRDLPGISTYLRVENYCRDRFEVASSKQNESFNVSRSKEITLQQEYLMGLDENSLRLVRESFLRLEGTVSGFIMVDEKIVPVEVSYRVPGNIIEWID